MCHHEAVAGADRVHQRMLGLGQHLVPLRRPGPPEALEVQTHQPAAFRVEVGAQEQRVAVDPDQPEFGQRLVDDLDRLAESAAAMIIEDRIEPEPVAALGALDDAHGHIVIIFGDLRPEDQLVVLGKLQDQLVVVLITADPVHAQRRSRQRRGLGAVRGGFMIEMGVDIRSSVRQPFGSGELGLDRHVVTPFPRAEIQQLEGLPVAAALTDPVRGQPAVTAHREAGHRTRAVRRQGVRIDQDPAAGQQFGQRVRDVGDVLVLPTVVPGDEVAAAAGERHSGPRPADDRPHRRREPLAAGKLGQRGLAELVLTAHPVGGLGRVGILQPAVRIGDGPAVQQVKGVVAPGGGVARHGACRLPNRGR